jgi:hypothetical protein
MAVELQAIPDEELMYEEEFKEEFEKAQPKLLGALLDGVAGGLRGKGGVSLSGWGRIRMRDFARFAEAGCRSLGFEEWEFLDAFTKNQDRTMRLAFDQNPVAQAVALLIEQAEGERWRGNCRPLLAALENVCKRAKRKDLLTHDDWPPNDTWCGRRLRRSVEVLKRVQGIEVLFDVDLRDSGEGGKDGLEIRRIR